MSESSSEIWFDEQFPKDSDIIFYVWKELNHE